MLFLAHATILLLLISTCTCQEASQVKAIVLVDQPTPNIKGIFRYFESFINVTALSGVQTSLSEVLGNLNHLMDKTKPMVIIGCLKSKLDHFVQFLAGHFSIPFICTGSSIAITDFQTEPVSRSQQESYSSMTEAIHLLSNNSDARHFILAGTQTQTNQILPLLQTTQETAPGRLLAAQSYHQLNMVNNKIKEHPSADTMTLEIALDETFLPNKSVGSTGFPCNNGCPNSTLFVRNAFPSHLLVGNVLHCVQSITQLIESSSNQTSEFFIAALRWSNKSACSEGLFAWDKNGVSSLTVEAHIPTGHAQQIAVISEGRIHVKNNYLRPNRRCKNPNALCTMVIEQDPGTFISTFEVTSDNVCYGHKCIRYVPTRTDNNGSATRALTYCCTGYFIDILLALKADLEFESEMYIVPDGKYGAYDDDKGRWNGMIAELIEGKADIALTCLLVTSQRQRAVDFADAFIHVTEYQIMMLVKQVQTSTRLFGFTDPFDAQLWATLFLCSVFLVVLLWVMDKLALQKLYPREEQRVLDLRTSFSYVWSSVFKIPLDDATAKSVSARLTYAVFSFGTFILMSTYIAKLTASLVQEERTFPVTGLRDPKFQDPKSGIRFGIPGGTALGVFLRNNSNSRLRKVGQNAIITLGTMDGIQRLRNGELDAVLGYAPWFEHLAAKRSGMVALVTSSLDPSSMTFAFPKRSKWKARISRKLADYRNTEFYTVVQRRWFKRLVQNELSQRQLTLMHMRGLFVILSSTIVGCFVVLLLEFWCYSRCISTKIVQIADGCRE